LAGENNARNEKTEKHPAAERQVRPQGPKEAGTGYRGGIRQHWSLFVAHDTGLLILIQRSFSLRFFCGPTCRPERSGLLGRPVSHLEVYPVNVREPAVDGSCLPIDRIPDGEVRWV
jgi:hypothetical protein